MVCEQNKCKKMSLFFFIHKPGCGIKGLQPHVEFQCITLLLAINIGLQWKFATILLRL